MAINYEPMEAIIVNKYPRSLIRLSGERDLVASFDAFGPGYINENDQQLYQRYPHPKTKEIITFREPTTAESISIASYNFPNKAKPQILDYKRLQIGRILKTSEGVFVNVPRDAKGELIENEQTLKSYLNRTNPVRIGNGKIWVVQDTGNLRDFGFAEINSFKQGVQDAETFAEGGLARILEHTEQKAEKLKEMASKQSYPAGVCVWGFNLFNKGPDLRLACLDSGDGFNSKNFSVCLFDKNPNLNMASLNPGGGLNYKGFCVYGDWCGHDVGYLFGILDSSRTLPPR